MKYTKFSSLLVAICWLLMFAGCTTPQTRVAVQAGKTHGKSRNKLTGIVVVTPNAGTAPAHTGNLNVDYDDLSNPNNFTIQWKKQLHNSGNWTGPYNMGVTKAVSTAGTLYYDVMFIYDPKNTVNPNPQINVPVTGGYQTNVRVKCTNP